LTLHFPRWREEGKIGRNLLIALYFALKFVKKRIEAGVNKSRERTGIKGYGK